MAYTREDKDARILGCPHSWTIEDAINAAEGINDRPFMDALRERHNKWKSFWGKRSIVQEDHDCGTDSGDGCSVCFKSQETAH